MFFGTQQVKTKEESLVKVQERGMKVLVSATNSMGSLWQVLRLFFFLLFHLFM